MSTQKPHAASNEARALADVDDIAGLDRQWAEIEAGAPTIPHVKVARWLETWGTPAFKPWHKHDGAMS